MRVVVQRVSRASVTIEGRVTGSIGRGLLILVGFTESDGEEQIDWMTRKLLGLRIFADHEDKMNLSVVDAGGAVLVVSQFTLYGETRKGNRPSFIHAAGPDIAIPLYEDFVRRLTDSGIEVATGEFGAMMDVELVNDGPVTIVIER